MNAEASTTSLRWWGEFEISRDAWRRWRIGPLSLWVRRLDDEWRLAHEEDAAEAAAEADRPSSEPPATATVERFAAARLGERLIVTPGLGDRSIVTRPETSFRLAAGGAVDLYVGTPVWLRLESAEPRHLLLDVPTRRPSDSWFGPSTTEGELSYAGRTSARLRRENLPVSPHRAVTRVRLTNRAPDPLLLERLNLPVPNLTLFADAEARLWTQAVSVEREEDGKLAKVRIDDRPPAEAKGVERLSEPREARSKNVFSRALDTFLG